MHPLQHAHSYTKQGKHEKTHSKQKRRQRSGTELDPHRRGLANGRGDLWIPHFVVFMVARLFVVLLSLVAEIATVCFDEFPFLILFPSNVPDGCAAGARVLGHRCVRVSGRPGLDRDGRRCGESRSLQFFRPSAVVTGRHRCALQCAGYGEPRERAARLASQSWRK